MMKIKIILLLLVSVLLILLFSQFISSAAILRKGFAISVPKVVDAYPGDVVTIQGTILPTKTMMRNVYLFVEGVPFTYTLEPNYFDTLPVTYKWTNATGLVKVPKAFEIKIFIPSDIAEEKNYTINVTGQETFTYLRIENSTSFQLRVKPTAVFSISQILFPENVVDGQIFEMNVTVKNEGTKSEDVTLSVSAPSDWNVTDGTQTVMIAPQESLDVIFALTPTNSSGLISLNMEYPYKTSIINITRLGPILAPVVPEEQGTVPTGSAVLVQNLAPVLIIFSLIFLILIGWNLYGIYKTSSDVRKTEETMKKGEVPA